MRITRFDPLVVDVDGLKAMICGPGPYRALSANESQADWPYWYVCGPNGNNILAFDSGAVFAGRAFAEKIAEAANAMTREA